MITPRKLFGGFGNRLFQMAYIYSQVKSGEVPDIYIQDEKYFDNVKKEIKALYSQSILPIDMVSVHIRLGDYKNNPFYVKLINTDYYEKALEQFPGEKFLVFCADRQEGSNDEADMIFCRKLFQGKNFEFFQGKDELEDFNTMSGCKGHIMANSSFSWWASYISEGKTVCPKNWFTDGVQRVSLLDKWIQI